MPRFTRDFGASVVSRGFGTNPNVGRVAQRGSGRLGRVAVGRVATWVGSLKTGRVANSQRRLGRSDLQHADVIDLDLVSIRTFGRGQL